MYVVYIHACMPSDTIMEVHDCIPVYHTSPSIESKVVLMHLKSVSTASEHF